MSLKPLDLAIVRFKSNEEHIDTFVNGGDTQYYTATDGAQVPSIRRIIKEERTFIEATVSAVSAETVARQLADLDAAGRTPVAFKPGYFPAGFTNTLAGGAPATLPLITAGGIIGVIDDDEGAVARFYNAGAVAPRGYAPLEVGRRYLGRIAIKRRTNTNPPASDDVVFGATWYDQNLNALADSYTASHTWTSLSVSSGRQVATFIVARAAGESVNIVGPAGARWWKPYCVVEGSTQRTDIEILGWYDITDAGAVVPVNTTALEARIAAQEAINTEDRLSDIEGQLGAPHMRTYQTAADLLAATVEAEVDTVFLQGYYEPGDGGGGTRKRGSSVPAALISDDGAYWIVENRKSKIQQFGGKDDGTTDCTPAMELHINHVGTGGTLYGVVDLPLNETGSYLFLGHVPTGINNVILNPDDGVTLIMPYNPPPTLRVTRPLTWSIPSQDFSVILTPRSNETPEEKSLWISKGDFYYPKVYPIDAHGLASLKIDFAGSDTFAADTAVDKYDRVVAHQSLTNDGKWHVVLYAPKYGAQLTFHVAALGTPIGDTYLGAFFRCTGGYAVVYIKEDNTGFKVVKPKGGSATVTQIRWAADTTNLYTGKNSVWTLEASPTQVKVALNGINILGGSVLDLPGFLEMYGSALCQPTAATKSIFVEGWTVEHDGPPLPSSLLSLAVIGDSRSAKVFGSCWADYTVRAIDGTLGFRMPFEVDNRAYPGDTAAMQLARMVGGTVNGVTYEPAGVPGTFIAVIDLNANDVQGQTDYDTLFEVTYPAILAALTSPLIFIVVQSLFWDTPHGQVTSHAELSAPYRARMMRFCAERGIRMIDESRLLGLLDPADLARAREIFAVDERDDIHPTEWNNLTKGLGIGVTIMSEVARPLAGGTGYQSLVYEFLESGVGYSFEALYSLEESGKLTLAGSLAIDSAVEGATVLQLPSMLRPRSRHFQWVTSYSTVNPVGLLFNIDGTVKIEKIGGSPITDLTISLDSISYATR